MRKVFFICAGVLLAVFVVLSLFGWNSEYAAERSLHNTLEKLRAIEKNPDVAPPKVLASIEDGLKEVLRKFPGTGPARIAYPKLAEMYVKDGKYDEAIALSDEILKNEHDNIALVSKAYFFKAVCYEKKDQWDKALVELRILQGKYVNTPLGLQTPFYIANHHLRASNMDKSRKYFDEAIAFYRGLMTEHKGTALGYAASDLLVQVYIYIGEAAKAGEIVESIISEYPTGIALVNQVPYIELIFVKTLKNTDKAVELYNEMIKKSDDDRVKKYLEAAIKRIKPEK